jgi:hypothetical protein
MAFTEKVWKNRSGNNKGGVQHEVYQGSLGHHWVW